MNQQQMNAALLQHDRVRRSTDLPLFYGRKDKDTTTARLMVDRIEMAAEIANWDDARNHARDDRHHWLEPRDSGCV